MTSPPLKSFLYVFLHSTSIISGFKKPIRQANALHKHIVFLAGEVMFDVVAHVGGV
jgi:hypothetical protein